MNIISTCSASAQILIVDDERIQRMIFSEALRNQGYAIIEADSGQRGLEQYQAHHPDIVLVDALMPGMNGFDCCTALRNLPNGEYVPIVMITGLNETQAIDRAFAVGATDFIAKPVKITLLKDLIQRLLKAAQTEKALPQREPS
jgi:sigma-B regulation protein RsbU (phosphoserine phosphatase)